MAPTARGFLEAIRRFRREHRGVAAVEFALILPVMLVIYLGGNELGHALTIARKVTHVTSSLADLVTQSDSLSQTDMNNILDAAASVISPYDESLLRIKISGVSISSGGVATVTWSQSLNDTARAVGSTISLPSGVATPSTFLVTAEVHYDFDPTFGYVLTGTLDLHDQFYLRPRLSDTITCCS